MINGFPTGTRISFWDKGLQEDSTDAIYIPEHQKWHIARDTMRLEHVELALAAADENHRHHGAEGEHKADCMQNPAETRAPNRYISKIVFELLNTIQKRRKMRG